MGNLICVFNICIKPIGIHPQTEIKMIKITRGRLFKTNEVVS